MRIESTYFLNGLELVLLCLVSVVAFWKPKLGDSFFRLCGNYWNRLAINRVGSVVAIAFAAILIRSALLPVFPVPDPQIHDEFGHLLIADTFASGRLTNPPHPYWQHFESIYILNQPTYTSQYPPATGFLLGVAEVLFGQPWLGVLIGMGAFCGAVCWMLQAWVPARWALLGGILAIFQFAILSYWINSYWGGAVPGIGGLLVLGGLGRLRHGHIFRNAIWIALGLAILMNSRPAEAFLFGCVTCALLCWWVFKTDELRFWPTLANAVLPMALFLCTTLGLMAYYNHRVTGHALELPYMLHQKLYGSPQAFWWQRPIVVKSFRFKEMQDDYLRQLTLYERKHSLVALTKATMGRVREFWVFYLGAVLTIPLLFFRWAIRDRGMMLLLTISIPFALDYLTFHAFYPHYAAPVAGVIMFIVIQCWRHLRVWRWRGKPSGRFLARMIPLVSAAGVLSVIVSSILVAHGFASQPVFRSLSRDYIPLHSARADILKKLRDMGGQHLIFVHYTQPGHSPDDEWVYNQADIDRSSVVWAREMGSASDDQLRRYYAKRRAWVLNADARPPQLVAYPRN